MRKKALSAFLSAAVAISMSSCAFAGSSIVSDGVGTKIIYDGKEISFDNEPINMDGTILVPMRSVFEALGTKVKWDGDTQTVYARKKSKTYSMTIGSADITETKNDEVTDTVTANEAMQLINERTMIPLRAVGEIFGLEVDWDDDKQTVTMTTPEDEDVSWKENIGTINVTTNQLSGEGVTADGRVITISQGGIFAINGASSDKQIVIDTQDKVELELSGCDITGTDGAVIYVKNADKCYITAKSGTTNTLSDGGEYSDTAETNAVIYTKDNTEIKGKGVLNINGNVHNGITAKDSLEISNGTVNIKAVADGIHVNDTCEISGGTVDITSGGDSIQAESILDINSGTVNINCTGEVTVSEQGMGGFGMRPEPMQGQNVENDGSNDTPPRGSKGDFGMRPEPMQEQNVENDDSNDISSKGLKAGWYMDISGGNITVNSNDTCIRCDSEIDISGGTITLTSESKKGIKGMEDVNISGGTIDIKKSTEGIETKRILTIDGGDISVIASDDGINAGGTGMGGGFGGRMPRGEQTEISTEHYIEINGGNVYINARGDGIDSNGSMVINGGTITIDGPVAGGNSALDHDGLLRINGGTVVAVGTGGMIEPPSAGSEQNVISAYVSASEGEKITIKDSSGKEVCSYTVKKATGHMMYSSDKIKTGEAYAVYVDGTEQGSGTIDGALTIIGSSAGGFGMGGGRGGRRGDVER